MLRPWMFVLMALTANLGGGAARGAEPAPAKSPVAAPAAAKRIYILNGFRLSGVPGVNPDEIIAKLKDHEDSRVTEDDLVADANQVGRELKARHIQGQLFSTMAEKDGRVWLLFDFQRENASK